MPFLQNSVEEKVAGMNGSGIDSDTLDKLLSEYTKKSDFKKLKKRVKKCEKKHKKYKPLWLSMEKDIEELKGMMKDKTENSLFDSEISGLKDMINQLANSGKDIVAPLMPTGPSMSAKDLADLKDLIKRVAIHDDLLKDLTVAS
jgi:protein subunit release factor A